ncbi:uncharacterized protein H6S33_000265 [Morchella sextelata]|uniref:uncharacterized protein n=1 Tax=Morchella sextelata TaxID=1174677 RepID=UPI001D041F50|nr:uncharacterized protein H6S33_000265 [Morchella sextelata]KAH0614629.1 hypothetical protein H6S33_000265 [Morchella sextelata]
MFPLYFPPVAFQQTASMDSVATLAPQCFAKQVDLREEEGYNYVCKKLRLFERQVGSKRCRCYCVSNSAL